ncbi:hypothetical protein F2Q70_00038636 [Brassica cretica]|uniref:Uncharacterized protein n=1 Tax=Brassica cretica TaxID=69181 RepID=A0A8S9GWN0_BRACR|nr:hypothetical protein F2Q68_00033484 [Brassica cretica]KAF2591730.1 hypothetical protein F2Q70_00038636 [Brassica cretica]
MHGLVSYRCFGRARSLRSDQAGRPLDRYIATGQRAYARVILIYCGDLDVNFVVTIFDPKKVSVDGWVRESVDVKTAASSDVEL